jgi:LAO/AO transport system kinase
MILNFRKTDGWKPDVLKSVANEGVGISEIAEEIEAHREYLETSGILTRKRQVRVGRRIRELVGDRLRVDFWTPEREKFLKTKVEEVMAFRSTPYEAARMLIADFTEWKDRDSR